MHKGHGWSSTCEVLFGRYFLSLAVYLDEEFGLNMYDRFSESFDEFIKIFLIQEDLVLFVIIVTDAFAFGNSYIEILFGFCSFDIKEIGSFSRTNAFRKKFLVVIIVFQGLPPHRFTLV
jgi:hypothetical protein